MQGVIIDGKLYWTAVYKRVGTGSGLTGSWLYEYFDSSDRYIKSILAFDATTLDRRVYQSDGGVYPDRDGSILVNERGAD